MIVLFPQRGDTINYYVDGEKRMQRGGRGEAAVIHINGKETGINTPIDSNDKIEISPSTKGEAAHLTIGQIPEFKSTLNFTFNGNKIDCARYVLVNGEMVSEYYEIKDEDHIRILNYYTLKQVLEVMDIPGYANVTVNNLPADMETKIYDNFTIICDVTEQIPIDYIGGETIAPTNLTEENAPESGEGSAEAGNKTEETGENANSGNVGESAENKSDNAQGGQDAERVESAEGKEEEQKSAEEQETENAEEKNEAENQENTENQGDSEAEDVTLKKTDPHLEVN